jgi:Uncharacterized conserved protein
MMGDLRRSDGTVVASDVEMADTVLKKITGVMFRRRLPPGFAMVFDMGREMRTNIAIHMVFVFVPIDVVYLDKSRTVVDIRHRLQPWIGIAIPKRRARYAIEIPAGAAEEHRLKEGDVLEWQ